MQSQMQHCSLEQQAMIFSAMIKTAWHVCACPSVSSAVRLYGHHTRWFFRVSESEAGGRCKTWKLGVIWLKRYFKKRNTRRWCDSHHALCADMHRLVMLIFRVLCRKLRKHPAEKNLFCDRGFIFRQPQLCFPTTDDASLCSLMYFVIAQVRCDSPGCFAKR